MVAVTAVVPALVATKEGISPVPLVARPMPGVVLVQLYVTPAGIPLKVTAAVEVPLQTVWLPGLVTVGIGTMTWVVVAEGRQLGSRGAGVRIAYT